MTLAKQIAIESKIEFGQAVMGRVKIAGRCPWSTLLNLQAFIFSTGLWTHMEDGRIVDGPEAGSQTKSSPKGAFQAQHEIKPTSQNFFMFSFDAKPDSGEVKNRGDKPIMNKSKISKVNRKKEKPDFKNLSNYVEQNALKDLSKHPLPLQTKQQFGSIDTTLHDPSLSDDSNNEVFLSPPKPKVLPSMIPEADLFQKVESGSTYTPHLLVAQRRLKKSNPLDYKVSMEKQWQNIISPLPMSPQDDQIFKENWNEVLKVMATPTNEEFEESMANYNNSVPNSVETPGQAYSLEDYRSFTMDPWSIFKEYLPAEVNISNKMTLPMKYIFYKILPLVNTEKYPDAGHESKYCNSKFASSCFVSLSCLYIIQSINDIKAKEEFLKRSAININKSLEYLMDFIKDNELLEGLLSNEDKGDDSLLFRIQKVVDDLIVDCGGVHNFKNGVLLLSTLMHVQVWYGILENGRSALSRVFFKLFAILAQNKDFKKALDEVDHLGYILISMSIWDTLSAVTSPDCRLPFCSPNWYDYKDPNFSTEILCGCPANLFICLSKICHLRNRIKHDTINRYDSIKLYSEINAELLNYRMYVAYDFNVDYGDDDYELNITRDERYLTNVKTAQLWSLSILSKLLLVVKPYKKYKEMLHRLTIEFFDVYKTLDINVTTVNSIVWPLMEISVGCETNEEKLTMTTFLKQLFEHKKALNLPTIIELVELSWEKNTVIEEILAEKEWLKAGIDLMPM